MKLFLSTALLLVAFSAHAETYEEGGFVGVLPTGEIIVQSNDRLSVCETEKASNSYRLVSCKPLILKLPSVVPAEAFSEELFVAILNENDCKMTEAEASNILPAMGYNKTDVAPVVQAMIAEGTIRMDDKTVVLNSELCK